MIVNDLPPAARVPQDESEGARTRDRIALVENPACGGDRLDRSQAPHPNVVEPETVARGPGFEQRRIPGPDRLISAQ